MKRTVLLALFATFAVASVSPLLAQEDARPKRKKSPVKVEMEKLEEAIEAVEDFLAKPEGDAPMAQMTAAQASLMEAKKHAPRATARLPKEQQAKFVLEYKIAINKTIRSVLDLEDALLNKDYKAAATLIGDLKKIEKAGHRKFKPRRRRRGSKNAGKTPASAGGK